MGPACGARSAHKPAACAEARAGDCASALYARGCSGEAGPYCSMPAGYGWGVALAGCAARSFEPGFTGNTALTGCTFVLLAEALFEFAAARFKVT